MSARASQQAVVMQQDDNLISWVIVRRALAFLISAGVISWLVFWLQQPNTLPISKIRALGVFEKVDENMLRSVVAQTVDGGYFSVNVDQVQSAVEQLPWVLQASVSRVWPDTISINIVEQKALAVWELGGLVNQQGTLFKPDATSYPLGLPTLDGPIGMQRNMTEFYQLAKSIVEPLGVSVIRIQMDSRRAYQVRLSNGIQLLLGREHTQNRLERFARVYKKVLSQKATDIASIDMRYSNGLAVGWKDKTRE